MIQVSVTDHALARWRERFGEAGDRVHTLIEAFRQASPLGKKDSLPAPFKRRKDSRYYLHAALGVCFVVDARIKGVARIVTVTDARGHAQ